MNYAPESSMFYRFALIVVGGGFLLVPAVPTWARRVDCVDGQTPPRQAVQCDVDGEVSWGLHLPAMSAVSAACSSHPGLLQRRPARCPRLGSRPCDPEA